MAGGEVEVNLVIGIGHHGGEGRDLHGVAVKRATAMTATRFFDAFGFIEGKTLNAE
jgi:hypothetical protein